MGWRPKTAMVLAAGLGTRMRPLTDRRPKPLVALAGRALIDHALDRIAAAGIAAAVVNVHHMADQIEAHLYPRTAPRITISDERGLLLETGGGVRKALPLLGPEPFLIHNSDTVWIDRAGSGLDGMIDAWDPERMDCLLLLAVGATSIGYDGQGDFDMDAAGRLARRRPDRTAPYVFAGVSLMQPGLLAGTPDGAFSLNRIWDRAIGVGRLSGHRLDGTWMHVGTPQALAEAEQAIARGEG